MSRRKIIPLLTVTLLSAFVANCLAATVADEMGRIIWPKDTLDMTIKATDELSGVKSVELWYRLEGGQWQCWPYEPEPTEREGFFKFSFKAPRDGVYDFYSVSIDSVGNSSNSPDDKSAPMTTINFDTSPPALSVNYRAGEARLAPGENLVFEWKVADANLLTVWASYYFNGDSSQAQHLVFEGTGGLCNLPVPKKGVRSVTIQVVAKDKAGYEKATKILTFSVEGKPGTNAVGSNPEPVVPETKPVLPERNIEARPKESKVVKEPFDSGMTPSSTSPGESTGKTEDNESEPSPFRMTIKYDVVQCGISGLDRVELWVAKIIGKDWKTDWTLYEFSRTPKGEFVFEVPEIGHYGFYIVAGNKAGVWSKPRPDGKTAIEPDYVKWVDPYTPFVKILSPHKGDILRGGGPVKIRWVANDDNLLEKPIKIELMRDGKSVLIIANATENNGVYDYEFPHVKGAFSIKIHATDTAGHISCDNTGTFLLDTSAPRVSIQIIDEQGIPIKAPAAIPVPAPRVTKTPPNAPRPVAQNAPAEQTFYSPSPTTPQPKPVEAVEFMERGRELLEMNQIEGAITELARASEYYPRNAAIVNEYGIALYRKGIYTQALVNFQKAVDLETGETRYIWNIFLAYFALNDANSAADTAITLLKMDGGWEEGTKMIDGVMLLYQNDGQSGKIEEFLKNVLAVPNLTSQIKSHVETKME